VHGSSSGRAWWMRDLTGKPGPTFPDRASKNLEYWRVMTLLRIVFPLHLFCLSMISRQTRTAFVPRENRYPLFRIMLPGRFLPQKGSPAKRTGHTLRVAAQYSQKTPKYNGLFGIWLADFGCGGPSSALFGGGIDPLQNLVKMGLNRLIAAARPVRISSKAGNNRIGAVDMCGSG